MVVEGKMMKGALSVVALACCLGTAVPAWADAVPATAAQEPAGQEQAGQEAAQQGKGTPSASTDAPAADQATENGSAQTPGTTEPEQSGTSADGSDSVPAGKPAVTPTEQGGSNQTDSEQNDAAEPGIDAANQAGVAGTQTDTKADEVAPAADQLASDGDAKNDADAEKPAEQPYTGWVDAAGKPATADAAKGWFVSGKLARSQEFTDPATGARYWADADGSIAHGMRLIPSGSKRIWVYYDINTGKMAHGEALLTYDAEHTGWYYFDPKTGEMAHGVKLIPATKTSPAKWVYYDIVTGKMAHGEAALTYDAEHTGWYYFDPITGAMQHGFLYLPAGKKWVLYDYVTGKMVHGERYIDGKHGDQPGWMLFDNVTGAVTYKWVYLPSGSKWVYYDAVTGRMRYGRVTIDGVARYLDPVTGAADKIGYQNPSQFYQASIRNVTMPSYAGGGIFSYITPSRIKVDATRSQLIETMISRAYEYLGTPYRWDYSCAPGVGVDCAGLVMQALYATGMDLSPMNPWDHYYTPGHDQYANYMWTNGRFMHVNFADRQRGDLISYPGHVAIYLGNDQIIEAFSPAVGVRVHSMYNGLSIRGVMRPFV